MAPSCCLRHSSSDPGARSAQQEAALRAACEAVAARVNDEALPAVADSDACADGLSAGAAGSLTLARRASVRAQWAAQQAALSSTSSRALSRSGTLARHPRLPASPPAPPPLPALPSPLPHEAVVPQPESLRRKMSLVAARVLSLQRAGEPRACEHGNAASLLSARLSALGLRMNRVAGDGNCQFRALALHLHGTVAAHARVRAAVVATLRAASSDSDGGAFAPLFETRRDFDAYCDDMARNATWGDELTLAAAADAYGVEVHVLQSSPPAADAWHLTYAPQLLPAGAPPRKALRVFVAYIAPVHYDAIVLDE